MFGIGLPEMIVILAVALIVVGPDKLPDMARSVAKWMLELKRTVNQVKESLEDEENLIGSVHSDLRKAGDELKGNLLESDHFTFHEPGGPKNVYEEESEEVIDFDNGTENPSAGSEELTQTQEDPDQDDSASEPGNKTVQ